MALKSYLIAPEGGGLQNDVEPWLIPEDAFAELEDAYIWRGRLRKRFGYKLLGDSYLDSRLRIDLGDTDGNGDISITVPGAVFKKGQMFSVGDEIFTVNATGTPATMLTTGAATTATYNTSTGALVINGADAATACYFYPAEPVMGIRIRENTSFNAEDTIAFDTQFAYTRSAGAWERVSATPASDAAQWSSSNSQFMWTVNYRGANPQDTAFWVTNYKQPGGGGAPPDGLYYLSQGSSTWTSLAPVVNGGGDILLTCKLLIPFQGRLVALNTIEGALGSGVTFSNRARYSQIGAPTTAATSWLDDTAGAGGFIDATTREAIITAEVLRNRLIVYFERSTWELVYTRDDQQPFAWQQLNSELGAESTFSVVGFDNAALGVGNVGIHACDGVSVQRIDDKIPDEVFKIHNGNSGVERVYGVRDFYRELVYWTYPDLEGDPTYPTKVLVFDYDTGTWAFINDSFTCFGNLQFDSDITWADLGERFGTWANWNQPWGSAQTQSEFPWILAGNQQGWTLQLDADKSSNSQSLYITDMASDQLTVIDHNLKAGDYVLVEDAEGVTALNDTIFTVDSVVDADTIVLDTTFSGTYTGGGKLTRISKLNVRSKQWNPGTPMDQQFRMPYIDFLLNSTSAGEISAHYYVDYDSAGPVQTPASDPVVLGSDVIPTTDTTPFGAVTAATMIWQRVFTAIQGQTVQVQLYLSDAQLRDYDIATSDFQLNATQLFMEPGGRITG